jgi:hypothetical protein
MGISECFLRNVHGDVNFSQYAADEDDSTETKHGNMVVFLNKMAM